MKKSTLRNLSFALCFFMLPGLFGHWQTSTACLLFLLCVAPAWLLGSKSRLFSVKVILGTVVLTVGVTLLLFYLLPENYHYQSHRRFHFTAVESFPVSAKLGLFLVLFVFATRILEKMLPLSISAIAYGYPRTQPVHQAYFGNIPYIYLKSRSLVFQIAIVLIIVLAIPLNTWMFDRGIGITGVAPTEALPFKLNGILTYTEKLIIPGIITLLYSYTCRSSLGFVLFLAFYAAFLGVATASRGAALLVMVLPLFFAWVDRRYMLFLVALLATGFAILLTTEARTFLHVVEDNLTSLNNSLGIIGSQYEAFRLIGDDFIYRILMIFPTFLGRIESFYMLFMSSQFDANAVGGPWPILLKSLHWGLVDLGHDAVHQEFFGHTVPIGFYNAAGTIASYAFWASNGHLWMLLFFTLTSSFFLVTFEFSVRRVFYKYELAPFLLAPFVFIVSIFYYMSPGWPVLNFIWLFFLFFAFVPRMSVLVLMFRIIGLDNYPVSYAKSSPK